MTLNCDINEVVLTFDDIGITSKLKNDANTILIEGHLKNNFIEKYISPNISFGIININKVLTILKTFNEQLAITIDNINNNIIFSSGNKKIKLNIIDITNIKNNITKIPEFEYLTNIKIPISYLKSIQNVCNTYNTEIIISLNNNKLTTDVNIGLNEIYTDSLDINDNNQYNIKFGIPLLNVISTIDDTINLSINNNKPAKIILNKESYIIKYIIAPLAGE